MSASTEARTEGHRGCGRATNGAGGGVVWGFRSPSPKLPKLPNGDVITGDAAGNAVNNGPWTSYIR